MYERNATEIRKCPCELGMKLHRNLMARTRTKAYRIDYQERKRKKSQTKLILLTFHRYHPSHVRLLGVICGGDRLLQVIGFDTVIFGFFHSQSDCSVHGVVVYQSNHTQGVVYQSNHTHHRGGFPEMSRSKKPHSQPQNR